MTRWNEKFSEARLKAELSNDCARKNKKVLFYLEDLHGGLNIKVTPPFEIYKIEVVATELFHIQYMLYQVFFYNDAFNYISFSAA
jgi:hypothetical protein